MSKKLVEFWGMKILITSPFDICWIRIIITTFNFYWLLILAFPMFFNNKTLYTLFQKMFNHIQWLVGQKEMENIVPFKYIARGQSLKTSTTNRAGVRDPHAHSWHRRAHTFLGTVIQLLVPAFVHCTLLVHLTSCL